MSTTTPSVPYHIKGLELADMGKKRIEWANQSMKVLQLIRKEFIKNQPLKGVRISACLHVTSETANLMITLRDGGAEIALCASNPLSTQDDVAAVLTRDYGIPVFAIRGEDDETRERHLMAVLDHRPTLTMDDGADLVTTAVTKRADILEGVIGGTEVTTSGVIRLRTMAKQGELTYPIIAVNDGETKQMLENRYGTGQSTIDGIIRATNCLLAGSKFVVAGYGWCGRGVAMRARGQGADVIVTEVNPVRALEAVMDGFRVMSMEEAARIGDVFCTVTGNKSVLRKEHFDLMKNGAIVGNAGYSNIEIDVAALEKMSSSKRTIRPSVEEYSLRDGRKINLIGEGWLLNLAAAEGNPAAVMDVSFAAQALAVEHLAKAAKDMEPKVYTIPDAIDDRVARLKLESMSVKIDRLTPDQEEYLASWKQ
jgi:adenosylhomocysteinase